jgi:hypothetical protein
LRERGRAFDDVLAHHIAPVHWNHVNLTGDYSWRQDIRVEKEGFHRAIATVPGRTRITMGLEACYLSLEGQTGKSHREFQNELLLLHRREQPKRPPL